MISISVYSVQLVVGLVANLCSLLYLLRERLILHNKNRMVLLLIHLTCADLIVSYSYLLFIVKQVNIIYKAVLYSAIYYCSFYPGYFDWNSSGDCLDRHSVLVGGLADLQADGFPQDLWLLHLRECSHGNID